ncbi:thiolase-like protein [Corynespora cassiicola Philippines]|uniref:Thiolase-like protein n=1 Tax=Corynespora cassiicola Philippines TaxID=1448308 RepID=A0A2T2NYA2_CORCC|nr:thiolase-like protein [Corynespora cassiicola Philippines]
MVPEKSASVPIYITGLAQQYPTHTFHQHQFGDMIEKMCPGSSAVPGIQRLVAVNQKTGIDTRSFVTDFSNEAKLPSNIPTIDELSRIFRSAGVDLTIKACEAAMSEAAVTAPDITHIVAVTCTDTGNPGYDLLVSQRLNLSPSVDRTLLHGVGCAGGLSALRQAANAAAGASQRNRPARILVVACEICSFFIKSELQLARQEDYRDLRIAPAIFSDAAAAVVICNQLGLNGNETPIYELRDWRSAVIPDTENLMEFALTLTKQVPKAAVGAIMPMFEQLQSSLADDNPRGGVSRNLEPSECDWAMHPGGAAILQGAQHALGLSQGQMRASSEVYKSHGNSSSPTVLIVLDQLRRSGHGRDNVVATSFGPGLSIEMITMKRCRDMDVDSRPGSVLKGTSKFRVHAKVE